MSSTFSRPEMLLTSGDERAGKLTKLQNPPNASKSTGSKKETRRAEDRAAE